MKKLILILVLFPIIALAQIPQTMNYQGRLEDNSGNPVTDDNYSIVFTIYDAATNGNSLWTETRSVTTEDGFFTLTLGENTSIDINTDQQIWLNVNIGGTDLTPRTKLSGSLSSLSTKTVENTTTAGNTVVTSINSSTGGISAEKIADGSVTNTELQFIGTVTSDVQTQLDGKQPNLPTQTGNSGKFLTTDGTNVSWGTVSSSGGAFTSASGQTTINNLTDDFIVGDATLDYDGSGLDTKMYFDDSKGAFRAGAIESDSWNEGTNVGNYSFAIGLNTKARGEGSVALGSQTSTGARAYNSVAMGDNTSTGDRANNSVAMGDRSSTGEFAINSVAMGDNTITGERATNSVAMGRDTQTNASNSVAMGYNTITGNNASNSVAMGSQTSTGELAINSVALGDRTSTGYGAENSIAMGKQTITGRNATNSVAMGAGTITGRNATNSVAMGFQTGTGIGAENSVAMGDNTIADETNSVAMGEYNDNSVTGELLTIGNGSTGFGGSRSNAFEVYKNGEVVVPALGNTTSTQNLQVNDDGKLVAGGGSAFTSAGGQTTINNLTDDFIVGEATLDYGAGTETKMFFDEDKGAFRTGTIASDNWDNVNVGSHSFATGFETKASGETSTAMGYNTEATDENTIAIGYGASASNSLAIALGYYTIASGNTSTAMGSEAEASGEKSTAMGDRTLASNEASTAMGSETEASGDKSTAMGNGTIASGNTSTAMGYFTKASGEASTAMGSDTEASGKSSTTMGVGTTAESYAETVIGTYNTDYTPDNALSFDADDRAFVIGNGVFGALSDALIVYKNGDLVVPALGNTTSTQNLQVNDDGKLVAGGITNLQSATSVNSDANVIFINSTTTIDLDTDMSTNHIAGSIVHIIATGTATITTTNAGRGNVTTVQVVTLAYDGSDWFVVSSK